MQARHAGARFFAPKLRRRAPLSFSQTSTGRVLELDARCFRFVCIGADSDVLRAAFDRYDGVIFGSPAYYVAASGGGGGDDEQNAIAAAAATAFATAAPTLTSVRVYVAQPDQSLNVHTDESYALSVSDESEEYEEEEGASSSSLGRHHRAHAVASIQATTVYGAVRALETFAQLVTRVDDPPVDPEWGTAAEWEEDEEGEEGEEEDSASLASLARHHKHKHKHHHKRHHKCHRRVGSSRFFVPATSVWDEPLYAHRGVLIDTARHYIPLPVLTAHLDAMAASKLNVLHWHATDDAAFSVDVPGAPELAARGNPDGRPFYSAADVATVVAAARDRGIRVIPEIDAPSHAASWGGAYPGALADCYDGDGNPDATRPPPLDPSSNGTYALLWRVLRGTSAMFPESKLHVGGDEVDTECWASNPAVREWASSRHQSMDAVAADFTARAVALVADLGRDAIVWQEAFEAGASLPPRTEVEVWRWWKSRGGHPSDPPDPTVWTDALSSVVAAGHRAILAAPWYLNLAPRGDADTWKDYYSVDPRASISPRAAALRVVGGEACVWGELVDATNLLPTAWPAAAAIGERLWSGAAPAEADAGVASRLEVHVCRLRGRGVAAAPVGPGWCPAERAEAGGEVEVV